MRETKVSENLFEPLEAPKIEEVRKMAAMGKITVGLGEVRLVYEITRLDRRYLERVLQALREDLFEAVEEYPMPRPHEAETEA